MTMEKASEERASISEVSERRLSILDTIQTRDIQVDNYHGLTASTVGVYLAVLLIGVSGLMNVIGSGAYARNIAASIGGSAEDIWLAQTTAITVTVLGPPIAQAADYWGRKWFVVSTTLIGFAGCMVVSRSTSMSMAIGGEVLAALGYSSQALLNAIASEILPRRWRPAAQGGLGLSSGFAAVFSLLFGFHMVSVSADGWRVFFYVTAGTILVSALLFAFLYNPPPRPLQRSLTTTEKLNRLDWTAYAFLALGIVLFNMALTWSNNPYPWKSSRVAATFAIGATFLVALAIHQIFFKKDGLCHHALFKKDRNCAIAFLLVFVEGMSFYASNAFYPAEMSILFETDLFRVGLRTSIAFFAAIVSSVLVSIYSSVTKDLRNPIIFAYSSIVIYTILMATATLGSSQATFAYPMFLGLGLGIAISNVTASAQLSAPPALIAITSGLLAGTRSFGGSIALPIFNSIFNGTFNKHLVPSIASAVIPLGLSPKVLPEFIGALAANNPKALARIPGVTPEIIAAGVHALKSTFLLSYRYVYVAAGCFSFVAVIASCFIINPKNDMNQHVDAPLNDEKEHEQNTTTSNEKFEA